MNKVLLIGRLTRDAETRYGGADGQTAIAKFTLAVDKNTKDGGADFVPCVAFNKLASVMDKYGNKGRKFAVEGHITTGSYKDKDGKTIYTQDVICDKLEFCDNATDKVPTEKAPDNDGFLKPDEQMDIPFN